MNLKAQKDNPSDEEIMKAMPDVIQSDKVDKNKIKEAVSEAMNQYVSNQNKTSDLQQGLPQSQEILPTQQINQEQNNMAQNGNMRQNLANNQETMYNNANESESDLDERGNFEQSRFSGNNETMSEQEQRGNTADIKNKEGQNASSRIYENNISQKQ